MSDLKKVKFIISKSRKKQKKWSKNVWEITHNFQLFYHCYHCSYACPSVTYRMIPSSAKIPLVLFSFLSNKSYGSSLFFFSDDVLIWVGFLLVSLSDLTRAPWFRYFLKQRVAIPARLCLALYKELLNLKNTTGTKCTLLYPALTHLMELSFTQSIHNTVNIDKKEGWSYPTANTITLYASYMFQCLIRIFTSNHLGGMLQLLP